MKIVLRIAEIGSLLWWLAALSVTNLFTRSLPSWNVDYQGCVRVPDMISYVECGQSWIGQFLGGFLTWAAIWTEAAYVIMDVLSIPVLLPLGMVWIASVILALACLFRVMLALVRVYQSVKA